MGNHRRGRREREIPPAYVDYDVLAKLTPEELKVQMAACPKLTPSAQKSFNQHLRAAQRRHLAELLAFVPPPTVPAIVPAPADHQHQDLPAAADDQLQDLPAAADDQLQDLPAAADDQLQDLPAAADDQLQDLPAAADDQLQDLPAAADDQLQDLPAAADHQLQDLPAAADDQLQDLPADADDEDLPAAADQQDLPAAADQQHQDLPIVPPVLDVGDILPDNALEDTEYVPAGTRK